MRLSFTRLNDSSNPVTGTCKPRHAAFQSMFEVLHRLQLKSVRTSDANAVDLFNAYSADKN